MYVLILGSFLCMTQSRVVPSAFDFYFWSNERGIFFQPSLLSLNCKLSCWKPTLSFLKNCSQLYFLFWELTFSISLVSDFFLFFYIYFCFGFFAKEKTKLDFLFHGERKNMGTHLFPLIEIKLSSRMVSLSQLSSQNRWKGKEIIRFYFTIQ